jgi:3-deoxy-manno-octulosonate cytidylyltransferase (CMP-KDO synthetase)
MNIVAIIPSRYASQRLPAKALADIHGKTMIQRVYEQTRQAKLVTDVIVATDDERIEKVVIGFGGKAMMTPAAIQTGSDRIAYAARALAADIIVNVQGDEPLIAPKLIDEVVRLLMEDKEAVVGTAVKEVSSVEDLQNPNIVKVVLDKNYNAVYFSRSAVPFVRDAAVFSQWLKNATFYKHFGIYVYRAAFLQQFASLSPTPLEQAEKLEQLRIIEHGYRIKTVVTRYDSIPVDTAEDLEKVRLLVTQKRVTV